MTSIPKDYQVFCVVHGWVPVLASLTMPTQCPIAPLDEIRSVQETSNPAQGYEPHLFFDTTTKLIKRGGSATPVKINANPSTVLVVSAVEGVGDFTTIKDAVASASAGTLVEVHPGLYIENNPINIPSQISVYAKSGPESVTVVAMNGGVMFELFPRSRLRGMKVVGNGVSGGVGVHYDGSGSPGFFSQVQECFFFDFDTGVELENGPNPLFLESILMLNTGTPAKSLSHGIYMHSGSVLKAIIVSISGHPFYNTTYGNRIEGVATDSSYLYLGTDYCTYGAHIDDDGEFNFEDVKFSHCDTGMYVGSNGTNSSIRGNSIDVFNSTNYDIDVQATKARIFIDGGDMNINKFNNPNSVRINGFYFYNDTTYDRTTNVITGELQIGTMLNPSSLICGEGKYLSSGFSVFTNTNLELGTWVDNTVYAESPEGSTFNCFGATSAGACLYLGHTKKFFGLRAVIDTAITLSDIDDLVYEFWNGTEWETFRAMSVCSFKPYRTIGEHFVETTDKQNVRFGLTSNTNFAMKTLNSVSKYWVRVRVVNALSGAPVVQQLKPISSTSKHNDDGHLEYFGDARVAEKFSWEINIGEPAGSSPGNQDIYLSDNINIGRQENLLQNGVVDRVGFNSYLPENIDTSFPIKLIFSYGGTSGTSGDVKWVVRWASHKKEDAIYTSSSGAPTAAPRERSLEFTTTITGTNVLHQDTAKIAIYNEIPRPSDGKRSILWITLERRGGDAEDTYDGHVYLVQLTAFYIKWCEGGNVLSY